MRVYHPSRTPVISNVNRSKNNDSYFLSDETPYTSNEQIYQLCSVCTRRVSWSYLHKKYVCPRCDKNEFLEAMKDRQEMDDRINIANNPAPSPTLPKLNNKFSTGDNKTFEQQAPGTLNNYSVESMRHGKTIAVNPNVSHRKVSDKQKDEFQRVVMDSEDKLLFKDGATKITRQNISRRQSKDIL